ncbi:hypothetical protein J6590_058422 [Homalodisca vitripennis]|nr:hypothetical protein J6590_058422 [Homalodisca vitripennis]
MVTTGSSAVSADISHSTPDKAVSSQQTDQLPTKVKESSLFSYSEHLHSFGISQPDNFRNNIFNKALLEAEQAFNCIDNNHSMEQVDHSTSSNQQDNLDSSVMTIDCGPPHSPDTVEYVENKIKTIKNICDTDLETSLTLAAEVGSALLAENSKLKQDLFEITLKNSELAKHITESTDFVKMNFEAQIEELEKEKEALIDRTISLGDTIRQLELQLLKEKELCNELELLYLDQDTEKERIIHNYEKEMARLQTLINQPKNSYISDVNLNKPLVRDSETQTLSIDTNSMSHPSSILLQLAELKVRQDQLEHQLTLHIHTKPCIHATSYDNSTAEVSQICDKNTELPLTKTRTHLNSTAEVSQICDKNTELPLTKTRTHLNSTAEVSQICDKNTELPLTKTRTHLNSTAEVSQICDKNTELPLTKTRTHRNSTAEVSQICDKNTEPPMTKTRTHRRS